MIRSDNKRRNKRKMGKVKSMRKSAKKTSKSEISKTHCQVQKEIQTFFHKLQQTVKESCNKISQDCTPLYADNKKKTSLKRDSTSVHTTRNKDSVYDNKYCQRCKCLLEIPLNEFPSLESRIPGFIGKCEVELSFIQAIIWLKSITAYIPQISVEKLQQLFDSQCNIRDQNRSIKDIHVESSLATLPNKIPSVHEMFNNSEQLTLSLNNILDSSYNISPMIHKSYTNFKDIQNESFSFVSSLKDQNKSVTELPKPGTSTGYVITNEERKKFLSRPYLIPDSDEESLSDLTDMFEESVTYNDVEELLQNFEHEQTSRKNSNNRANNEIIKDENINSTLNDADISSKHSSVSLSRCPSIESILNLEYKSDNNCIILSLTGQSDIANNVNTLNNPNYTLINDLTQSSINDINLSQIISPISCMTPREQNNANNFQTDQVQSKTSRHYNDADFEYQINSYNNSPCIQMSDVVTENEDNDSAYSTWEIKTLNYDTTTTKLTTKKPCTEIKNHYNLRPRKEVIKHKETIASSSLIQKPVRKGQYSKEKSSSKKRKSEPAKNVPEKTKKNKNEVISANWLNFTVDLLNAEHIIHTSVKVILSTICDKRTAQQYAKHRCWKDSLEEQAVDAVLNIVDILKTEKKPNICEDLIEKAIIETLDEMMTSVQLNETSIWIFRIQIILQFCHLLSICVKTINYLIVMLESLQYILINTMNGNEIRILEINQLHLVSYALDVALRRYRVLVPREKKPQVMKTTIPCIADLWKMRYKKNEELEDVSFDLDATEKEWINVLQKFTVVSVKHFIMAQFADVSFSLYNILISV